MAFVELALHFPDLAKIIKENRKRIELSIAASMQTNRGMLFDKEGAHNGHEKWAPLKFRNGQILSHKGVLRRSMAPIASNGRPGKQGYVTFGSDFVAIGTNLFYAALMNFGTTRMPGGVMRAGPGKVLAIPIPQGKNATESAKMIGRESKEQRINRLQYRLMKAKSDAQYDKVYDQLIKAMNSKDNPTGKRAKVIFRKWVRIPERRFDTWTPEDEAEMTETLKNTLEAIIQERANG